MRKLFRAPALALLVFMGLFSGLGIIRAHSAQTLKDTEKSGLKPDVAALLKQSTDAYKKMKSYRHTARFGITIKGTEGDVHEDLNFTLALERPNRFAYKLDTKSQLLQAVAAYCDGSTFINFKTISLPAPTRQYTKSKAPASYSGINIVDDVEFAPMATYLIALMLQGDLLADKDIRAAMEKATVKPTVTENGKKWLVLEMPFRMEDNPYVLYFGQDDHLLGKVAQKGDNRITEVVDAVKIDKPIEPATFQYALPPDAKQVERFSAPQRPDDARLSTRSLHAALH